MPNAYAHYKLGWDVVPRLSPGLRGVPDTHKALYQAGFYGPDIFFYYKPLAKTAVGQLGNALHRQSASVFFTRAKERLHLLPDPLAAEAYLLGYVSHFALDSCCHSYVEYMVEQRGMNHGAMESDLDRELLTRDGLNPVRHHTAAHLGAITPGEAAVIAGVHGKLSPAEALEAVRSMGRYSRFLLPATPLKRKLLEGLLRLSGQYALLHGLLMPGEQQKTFRKTTEKLLLCYEEAVSLAVELMEGYHAFLRNEAPLPERFHRIFDGDEKEKEAIKERMSDDENDKS